ncbi:thermonuclease family protein [Chryseobacterium taklimakanense]|uniref:thermonuclease family protein n=1 Tax=Chryseobacterium taklimakanense TaxID=536441 RepID=UPI00293E13B0|nr:thermonuclease family protein [Chryseobacterium taklimakanense]
MFYRNQNLNKELLRKGLAWHFKRYSRNSNYAQLEIDARKKKIGLWQDKNPVEPWNWRKFRHQKAVTQQ